MTFKKLDSSDEILVFGLLKEAALWLKGKGIDYWQNWLDPPEHHYKWICDGIAAGEFYAVYEKDSLLGMFRLQYEDELFWGKKRDKAGYIHSFTVKREYSGRNIGYQILSAVEKDLAARGFDCLRLDCDEHLYKLRGYYEGFGFKSARPVEVDGYKIMLMEKQIRPKSVYFN